MTPCTVAGHTLWRSPIDRNNIRVYGDELIKAHPCEETVMANSIMVIMPYWHAGTWVFDDEQAGLLKEPFVAGADEMLTCCVAGAEGVSDATGEIPSTV